MVWRDVALSEIARPIERRVQVLPGMEYRTIGVKWWGEGAYERTTIDGAQTAARTLNLVRKDDLIINKIWVRHGSVAVADRSVDGCAASGEFPMFELDRSAVIPEWMRWQCKQPAFWTNCAALSHGSSGKNRIRPDVFLSIHVQIPPLAEQRRIVARIEKLAAKIEEARRLRQKTAEDLQSLSWSFLFGGSWPTNQMSMRNLVSLKTPDVEVEGDTLYRFAGVYSFGRGVFPGQYKRGSDFAYRRLTRLRTDNFVYPKLMAWEGALGVVPPDCDGLVVSPEFPVFEIDEDRVLPEVIETYFRASHVWPLLSAISTGTNLRRRRLHPEAFLNFEIPIPPMGIQVRFRQLRYKQRLVEEGGAKVSAELDGLLPSLLESAFTGQL